MFITVSSTFMCIKRNYKRSDATLAIPSCLGTLSYHSKTLTLMEVVKNCLLIFFVDWYHRYIICLTAWCRNVIYNFNFSNLQFLGKLYKTASVPVRTDALITNVNEDPPPTLENCHVTLCTLYLQVHFSQNYRDWVPPINIIRNR
jgi:hypothetical protein